MQVLPISTSTSFCSSAILRISRISSQVIPPITNTTRVGLSITRLVRPLTACTPFIPHLRPVEKRDSIPLEEDEVPSDAMYLTSLSGSFRFRISATSRGMSGWYVIGEYDVPQRD